MPDFNGTVYFDVTKWRRQHKHSSGLNRVSYCLREAFRKEIGERLVPVYWSRWKRAFITVEGNESIREGVAEDIFLTPEQFSLRQRFGLRSWLRGFAGKSAVIYYDSIPYEHPDTTWPASVKRFPAYFQDLGEYDGVFYISQVALESAKQVSQATGWEFHRGPVIPLGADHIELNDRELQIGASGEVPLFVNIGILEWRKGQDLLIEAAELLWQEGHAFRLVLAGRRNPHFGEPLIQRISALAEKGGNVRWMDSPSDAEIGELLAAKAILVMPSRAEGYGMPVVEGLARGLPVICSRQPCLENETVSRLVTEIEGDSIESVAATMRLYLRDDFYAEKKNLILDSISSLPQWKDTVETILSSIIAKG